MAKFVTFGEIMLRLSTPGFQRFGQAAAFEAQFGGGEANVAVGLAQFGHEAKFVTRLPKNDLAEACLAQVRGFGVDVSATVRGGDRMGLYFLETGASQRSSQIIYDRAGSSFAQLNPASFDWKAILKGAEWFHCSGITPAVSDGAAAALAAGAAVAAHMKIPVSCDINYRAKLWSIQKAGPVMTALMKHVTHCIVNEEHAEAILGVKVPEREGVSEKDRYTEIAAELTRKFGFEGVAITLRRSQSALRNQWSGLYYTGGVMHSSPVYDIEIVDRIGGGDAFAAGLIHGLIEKKEPEALIKFAVASGVLKHSIPGDFNRASVAEVEALAAGDGSGRFRR